MACPGLGARTFGMVAGPSRTSRPEALASCSSASHRSSASWGMSAVRLYQLMSRVPHRRLWRPQPSLLPFRAMSHNTPSLDGGAATLKAPAAELPGAQLEELIRQDRYEPGPLIGKGGMGEVRQCRDTRLQRHIALKTATTKNKAELSRFVREAQVQGMLEHPGIVPVHELGIGPDGAPYFAMKRVH